MINRSESPVLEVIHSLPLAQKTSKSIRQIHRELDIPVSRSVVGEIVKRVRNPS